MPVDLLANSLPQPPPSPPEIGRELDAFADQFARFNRGELSAEHFRQYRLGFGVYGQKQPGVHMVRVKLPAGGLRAGQMETLAGLSERFASGVSHLTTRQDVQFHFVPAEKLIDLLRALAAAGLTTREACGSTVRNVTACPDAGSLGSEKFDVRPYALAVSNYFLRNPFAQQLARKFKIALSACPEDCTLSAIHDAGLTAAIRAVDGRRQAGFRLVVGGGLGATPFAARLLAPFVPADELLVTLRALLKVYAAHGNRRQRVRARIKFLIHRLGIESFRDLVEAERRNLTELEVAEARLEDYIPDEYLPLHALNRSGRIPAPSVPLPPLPAGAGDAEFRRWHAHNVRPHRDPAMALATILTPLGDLRAEVFRSAASIAREFSRGEGRISIGQNLVLPAVERVRLPALHRALGALGLAGAGAGTALDITACAGADTCGLGITSSKGVAVALHEALLPLAAGPGLESLRGLAIKVSGCPNACGQHSIADIGLHGVVLKENGRQIPAYQFHLGGNPAGDAGAQIARPLVKIPARRAPAALAALAARFQRDRIAHESFHDFFARVGEIPLVATLVPFANPLAAGEDAALDWGQLLPFTTRREPQPAPAAAPDGVDPFAETRAALRQAGEFMVFGQREDALASLQRARYAIARQLLEKLGKQPESDYETGCEIRAQLVDRGLLGEGWNELHRALEAALRQRHPPSSLISALQVKLELFLAEARELLPSLGKPESLEIPA